MVSNQTSESKELSPVVGSTNDESTLRSFSGSSYTSESDTCESLGNESVPYNETRDTVRVSGKNKLWENSDDFSQITE